MIKIGLVGAADARSRWFLAAARRRRAGVRIVGLSEPDPTVREEAARLLDLPAWQDHLSMLDAVAPNLVAVAQADPGRVVIDALRHNADVLVLPPLCGTAAELDSIVELAATTGRRVSAAVTYRGHPATRTAQELIKRLGRVELVSLLVDAASDEARTSILEAMDVFRVLTGAPIDRVTMITDGHPAREDDPAELRTGFGELILVGSADAAADAPAFEVRRRPDDAGHREVIQIVGDEGAVEWDTRTGTLRSALAGRDPVTVSCGAPDQAEWLLNNLIRRREPLISTEYSAALTRALLSAELS
ncbi:MAG TPA: Gfo/Idh/MocA family oxidoreductase [Microlunatus sp.]